jgi:hypothetical protein
LIEGATVEVLHGKQANSFKEAVALAFEAAGVDDMSPESAGLFTSAIDVGVLYSESGKTIDGAVHARYGRGAGWSGRRWVVPIPSLRFDTVPIPQLTIKVQGHVVARVEVEAGYRSHSLTLVGSIGKSQTMVIPVVFLSALLDDDLDRFRVVSKDGTSTSWEIPGTKQPVELADKFVTLLRETLSRKSVARWLEDFGSQSRGVAVLVIGTLLGIAFAQPLPPGQRAWDEQSVIETLRGLGYSTKAATEALNRAMSDLRAGHTLEEAIRLILQQAGKVG